MSKMLKMGNPIDPKILLLELHLKEITGGIHAKIFSVEIVNAT